MHAKPDILDAGLYTEYEFCSFVVYLDTKCYLELKKKKTQTKLWRNQ